MGRCLFWCGGWLRWYHLKLYRTYHKHVIRKRESKVHYLPLIVTKGLILFPRFSPATLIIAMCFNTIGNKSSGKFIVPWAMITKAMDETNNGWLACFHEASDAGGGHLQKPGSRCGQLPGHCIDFLTILGGNPFFNDVYRWHCDLREMRERRA